MEEHYDESGLSSQLIGSHGIQTKAIVCSVCGAASWSENQVGFYVCNECGTQSQHIANETTEYDENAGTLVRRATTGKRIVQKYVTANDILQNELIESKLLLDIFQYLLQQQCHALIDKHNLPESLNEHMRTVWFSYLQWWINSGWAPDERYLIVNKAGAAYRKVDQILPVKDEEHVDETIDLPDPFDITTKREPVDIEQSTNDNDTPHELLQPGEISMELSIVILYIACIRLQTTVLLNDLRIWCSTGDVPYLNVYMLPNFPTDLYQQLQQHSNVRHFFDARQLPPSVTTLHKLANTVNDRIQIVLRPELTMNELPILQLNITGLFERFITQLSLPTQLIALSMNLFTTLDSTAVDEQFLAACVVFVTKLCYGLDDTVHITETIHNTNTVSQQTPQRRKRRKLTKPLFNNLVKRLQKPDDDTDNIRKHRTHTIPSIELNDTLVSSLPAITTIPLFTGQQTVKVTKQPLDMTDDELIDYVSKYVVAPINRKPELQPYIDLLQQAVDKLEQQAKSESNNNNNNNHNNLPVSYEPAYKSFILYKPTQIGELHKHYKLMLNAMVDMVGCTEYALHNTVQRIAKHMLRLNGSNQTDNNDEMLNVSQQSRPLRYGQPDVVEPTVRTNQLYTYLQAMKFPPNVLANKNVESIQLLSSELIVTDSDDET